MCTLRNRVIISVTSGIVIGFRYQDIFLSARRSSLPAYQFYIITGKAMFQMCGVFAEFERSIIRERINAGLARARANGKKLGRPRVEREVENAIRRELKTGAKGMRKIAREMGVGVSVVQRVKVAQE